MRLPQAVQTTRENAAAPPQVGSPVVEHKAVPEDEPPNTFGNDLNHFADDGAAVAMSEQHNVGEIAAYNEVHDRPGRLCVADLSTGALAVSCNCWPKSIVAVVLQAVDDPVPDGSVVP